MINEEYLDRLYAQKFKALEEEESFKNSMTFDKDDLGKEGNNRRSIEENKTRKRLENEYEVCRKNISEYLRLHK